MEVTGVDYIFYTNKDWEQIRIDFERFLKEVWPNFMIDNIPLSDNSVYEGFYSRDSEMLEHHDENGYSSDARGESCVFLIMRVEDLNAEVLVKNLTDQEGISINDFGARLVFKKLTSITIVLPNSIEECVFSNRIYNALFEIVGEGI